MADQGERRGLSSRDKKIIAGVAVGLLLLILIGRCSSGTNGDDEASAAGTTTMAAPETVASSQITIQPDELTDLEFIAKLVTEDIPYGDTREDGVNLGRTVCIYLDQPNAGIPDAIAGLLDYRPEFNQEQAGFVVGAAISSYCPEEAP